MHVEVDARDLTPLVGTRLRAAAFEVNCDGTLPIHGGIIVPNRKPEVAAVIVEFSNRWHEVVQIAFSLVKEGVCARAVSVAPILPALTLMPDNPGRNDVFPFDATSPVRVFANLVSTRLEVHAITVVKTTAIELGLIAFKDLRENFLGIAKVSVSHLVRAGNQCFSV